MLALRFLILNFIIFIAYCFSLCYLLIAVSYLCIHSCFISLYSFMFHIFVFIHVSYLCIHSCFISLYSFMFHIFVFIRVSYLCTFIFVFMLILLCIFCGGLVSFWVVFIFFFFYICIFLCFLWLLFTVCFFILVLTDRKNIPFVNCQIQRCRHRPTWRAFVSGSETFSEVLLNIHPGAWSSTILPAFICGRSIIIIIIKLLLSYSRAITKVLGYFTKKKSFEFFLETVQRECSILHVSRQLVPCGWTRWEKSMWTDCFCTSRRNK